MHRLTRRTILLGGAASLATQLAPGHLAFAAGDDPNESTDGYDDLLSSYVRLGNDGVARVRYSAWTKSARDLARLDTFIAAQSELRPSAMDRAAAFAYWANLYNALTLRVVLTSYPVRSIKDIKSRGTWFDLKALSGPWRTKLVQVEGVPMSLDDIEHGTMRPTFHDPRVHYAVNCASIGCPNLQPNAWRASSLEADLDAAARAYVNHPRGARVGRNRSLRVSSLYKWYKEDFGSSDAGVIQHLRRYASEPLAAQLQDISRISGTDYDWALNAA